MKIIVFEPIPLLLQAISELFEARGSIVFRAKNDRNILGEISDADPNALWVDASFPDIWNGILIISIHKKYPELKIVLFGPEPTVPEIRKFYRLGICAYLLNTSPRVEIEAALDCLASGKTYIPPTMIKAFASWLTEPSQKKKPGCKLTHREQEVLQLIVDEFTTQEIAQKLYIRHCTVETHRNNLIHKLGVKNTAGLVREAIQRQLFAK